MRGNYSDYLRSPYWRAIRKRVLIRDGHRCTFCGSTRDLNVHHKDYGNLGHEIEENLTTWCRSCHAAYHEVDLPADYGVDGPEHIADIVSNVYSQIPQRVA